MDAQGQRVLTDEAQVRETRTLQAADHSAHERSAPVARPDAVDAGIRLNANQCRATPLRDGPDRGDSSLTCCARR